MHSKLKQAYRAEIQTAAQHYQQQDWQSCFYHLENAHILGQSNTLAHTYSHWWMLKLAFRTRHFKGLFGQSIRLIASIFITRLWIPVGNTGGSNVSAFKPMPIRKELEIYFADGRD